MCCIQACIMHIITLRIRSNYILQAVPRRLGLKNLDKVFNLKTAINHAESRPITLLFKNKTKKKQICHGENLWL